MNSIRLPNGSWVWKRRVSGVPGRGHVDPGRCQPLRQHVVVAHHDGRVGLWPAGSRLDTQVQIECVASEPQPAAVGQRQGFGVSARPTRADPEVARGVLAEPGMATCTWSSA